jgi:hypothetical protein
MVEWLLFIAVTPISLNSFLAPTLSTARDLNSWLIEKVH